MSEGVELVTAWMRLVPTLEGVTKEVTEAFAPGVKGAEEAGDQAGRGWASKVKGAISVAAIGTGIVASFKGLYEVGEIFDDVTDTIRTGTGAQGAALDGLVGSAKNVGLQVPAEFEQIGTTVADLNTRLGLTGGTLETVASQYLEAGRILGEEVDINQTSAAFSAFRIEGEGVIGAMDSLFQVSQATGVGMNELAAGVQANAPALQNLGFGFEDSISLLGSLDKAGLNSTQVMASLSKGLVTLAKDGEQPADAFQRVVGELQGYVEVGDTAAALDLASQVFGTRGASQFVGALQSGVLNMNDLMAATGATGDTILGVGAETMDFAEQWQMTMNTAMVAIEPLATAVFAAVGEGLAAAMPFLQDLGAWVGENTETIGLIAGVIGGGLVAAFAAWTAGIVANTVAMLAWPGTWIILGIMALIGALVLLIANWDQVVAFVSDIWSGFVDWITGVLEGFAAWWDGIWSGITGFVRDAWQGISDFFAGIWEGIKGFFQAAVDWLVNLFLNWTVYGLIIQNWDAISQFFVGLWEGIKGFFQGAVDWLVDLFLNWTVYGLIIQNWDAIAQFFVGLWNGIVSFVQTAIQQVSAVVQLAVSGIRSFWQSTWSGIASFFSSIWNGIVGAVKSFGGFFQSAFSGIAGFVQNAFSGVLGAVKGPLNGIIGIINNAIRALNSLRVTIPDWVPAVGGQTWGLSLPTIPMLAEGATILPRTGGTLAILAEAGRPETVVDTGLMNRALEEGLEGRGSGAGVTQNFYIQNLDEDAVARKSRREATQALAVRGV